MPRRNRKPARNGAQRDVELVDLHYRAQHVAVYGSGPVIERCDKQQQDAQGNIGSPFIVTDTLRALHRNGTIDDALLATGRQFEEDFRRARFDPLRCADMARIPGLGGGDPVGDQDAKDRVWDALQRVGGLGSCLAGVLCDVLGKGMSLRQYVTVGGGYMRHQTASVLLKAALEVISAPKRP